MVDDMSTCRRTRGHFIYTLQFTRFVKSMRGVPRRLFSSLAAASIALMGCDSLVGVAPVAVVQVTPDSVLLEAGERASFSVTLLNIDGVTLKHRKILWRSSESRIASIDSLGMVVAGEPGQANVTAFIDGAYDTAVVRVLLRFASVSAGAEHACGLTGVGIPYCWGSRTPGFEGPSPRALNGSVSLLSLTSSGLHTCGLNDLGAAYCWGENSRGQLGDGTRSDRGQPVLVLGGLTFESLSAGWAHTCGITSGGKAHCWGLGFHGQLGYSEFVETCGGTQRLPCSTRPLAPVSDEHFTAVASGAEHTCAISSDGGVYCWGSNRDGRLGVDSLQSSIQPVRIAGDRVFSAITAGFAHTCALDANGIAVCWGRGTAGQVGEQPDSTSAAPVPIPGSLTFVALAAGANHTCGLTLAGRAFCWGDNSHGQLGLNSDRALGGCTGGAAGGCSALPIEIEFAEAFRQIDSGARHTCGVTTQNRAYCWGSNERGQLGAFTSAATRAHPVPASGWYIP